MSPASIDALHAALGERRYAADRGLATTLFLALKLKRPVARSAPHGGGVTRADAP